MTEDEKVIEHLRSCDKHPERASIYTFDNAIECIKQLRKERDEARQEICHTKKRRLITHLDYARKRGWNCFWVDYSKQQETTP